MYILEYFFSESLKTIGSIHYLHTGLSRKQPSLCFTVVFAMSKIFKTIMFHVFLLDVHKYCIFVVV